MVEFQVGSCDGSICGAEVGHHGDDGYVCKTKRVVIQHCEEEVLDGLQELLLHFFMCDGCSGYFG